MISRSSFRATQTSRHPVADGFNLLWAARISQPHSGLRRVAIGSDWKQFFSSDPTKNKNESDLIWQKNLKIAFNSICFNSIKQYANLIWLKRIKFSKIFVFVSINGSKPNHKTVSVGVKPTDFRRTSDPTRPP